MTDEELSPMIAALRPEPRPDLALRTIARVEAASRRRRARAWAAAGTVGLAAAAAAVMVLHGAAPTAPTAPTAPATSPYLVRLAEGASQVTPAGLEPLAPAAVPPGTRVETSAGGRIVLEADAGRVVSLAGATHAEIQMNQVRLERGAAELRGPARLGSELATLIGLEPASQAEVTLGGKDAAMKSPAALTLVAAATLLSVHVSAGHVRVETSAGALVLGPGDRQLVPSRGPSLLVRAAAKAGAGAGVPAPGPDLAKRAPTPAAPLAGAPAAPTAAALPPGELDKNAIRTGIREIIPAVRGCYEKGLERDPSLQGRLVVEFDIADKDGEGRITSAEVQPGEDDHDFMNAPLTAQCIVQALAEARFPVPKGGGAVHVTYPFVFMTRED